MANKSPEELVKEIKSRFSQLKSDREKFIDRWQEAEQYVAPTVYNWNDLDAIPDVPTRYESSPCQKLKTLVAGLVGYSISPNIVWFKFSMQDNDLLRLYGVKDWLEESESYVQGEYNRSNLYSEAPRWVESAAIYGHSVMLIDEDLDRGKLRFSTMRNNEIYLDVDDYGEVDTVFREYRMTIRNAVKFFGIDALDETIQEKYQRVETWNEKINILYAVYPREERDDSIKNAQNKPYAAVYVDLDHNKLIRESGYDEMPFAVFQWDRISGLAYSNSPAISAMPDIKALNIIRSSSLKIAQTSAEPPLVVPSSIRTVNLVPRGRTYVDDPARDVIQPIKTGENYPITLQVLENYEQKMKDWFFVDFFLMLQSKQGQMTATEVMELQGEKSATLANLVVALNEGLSKIIKRSFNLLVKAGRIPPVPSSLIEEGKDASMKIEFVGPLAQAQQKYHAMGGINQALNLVNPIISIFPNAGDYIDGDALMKKAMEGQGMPQAVIREELDVEKLRKERAIAQQNAQAMQQQMQMQQELVQNADKLGKTPEQGSLINSLNSQIIGGMNSGSV